MKSYSLVLKDTEKVMKSYSLVLKEWIASPLILLCLLAVCLGCAAANASHLGKAQAVVALYSGKANTAPPIIIDDKPTALETLPDNFAHILNIEIAEPATDNYVSVQPDPRPDIREAIDGLQLPTIVSPKEETLPVATKATTAALPFRGACANNSCAPPANSSGGGYADGSCGSGDFRGGPGIFGGRGIPLIRRLRRR